jgi:hypothetical protein
VAATVVDAWAAVATTAELARIDPAALSDTIVETMIFRPILMSSP